MNSLFFSDIENTISFWTRNDFAIANNLLVGNRDWETVLLAYGDNRGILEEYENGTRKIESDYDIKWINSLRSRLINSSDEQTRQKVFEIAKKDITNIINTMRPINKKLLLYRTAWISKERSDSRGYPYSHQYPALRVSTGDVIDINIISSTSITPYMENETEKLFYRYEISIPANMNVLELDQYECHNEDGEVLLPPMKCKIKDIQLFSNAKCRGIIEMEYIEQLSVRIDG